MWQRRVLSLLYCMVTGRPADWILSALVTGEWNTIFWGGGGGKKQAVWEDAVKRLESDIEIQKNNLMEKWRRRFGSGNILMKNYLWGLYLPEKEGSWNLVVKERCL